MKQEDRSINFELGFPIFILLFILTMVGCGSLMNKLQCGTWIPTQTQINENR